jgi:hypothetical protein
MEAVQNSNAGKTAAVTGLILGIIGLPGGIFVLIICLGWASFEGGLRDAVILDAVWFVLSAVSFVLSMTGRKKMKASGRSSALGTTGMIFGLLNISLCISILILSVSANNML